MLSLALFCSEIVKDRFTEVQARDRLDSYSQSEAFERVALWTRWTHIRAGRPFTLLGEMRLHSGAV
jgi:hypothetical protein